MLGEIKNCCCITDIKLHGDRPWHDVMLLILSQTLYWGSGPLCPELYVYGFVIDGGDKVVFPWINPIWYSFTLFHWWKKQNVTVEEVGQLIYINTTPTPTPHPLYSSPFSTIQKFPKVESLESFLWLDKSFAWRSILMWWFGTCYCRVWMLSPVKSKQGFKYINSNFLNVGTYCVTHYSNLVLTRGCSHNLLFPTHLQMPLSFLTAFPHISHNFNWISPYLIYLNEIF